MVISHQWEEPSPSRLKSCCHNRSPNVVFPHFFPLPSTLSGPLFLGTVREGRIILETPISTGRCCSVPAFDRLSLFFRVCALNRIEKNVGMRNAERGFWKRYKVLPLLLIGSLVDRVFNDLGDCEGLVNLSVVYSPKSEDVKAGRVGRSVGVGE